MSAATATRAASARARSRGRRPPAASLRAVDPARRCATSGARR